jgi:hypothetical protein
VEVFIGKTGCALCPVAAVTAYSIARGVEPVSSELTKKLLQAIGYLTKVLPATASG